MSLLIGLDIGWSERNRSCGVAVLGAELSEPGTVRFGEVCAIALFKRDVARVLSPLVRLAADEGSRVLIVADAIVGSERIPPRERHVDSACSRKGFSGRAHASPATTDTGRMLSQTLHEVMDELVATVGGRWTPWLGGGPLPESGIVVVETHPTVTMALALSMAEIATLPAGRKPAVLADGTTVRAKSDWYWRCGAGALAAEALGEPAVAKERDHERVAGLWCLALARELDAGERGALLGDEAGTYLAVRADPSWRADVERVGCRWGSVSFEPRQLTPPVCRAEARVSTPASRTAGVPARDDSVNPRCESIGFSGEVSVRFTDDGGLSVRANPWLEGFREGCRLRLCGRTEVDVVLTPFKGPSPPVQFRVSPTIGTVMRGWGDHRMLSGKDSLVVKGFVLSPPSCSTCA